MPKISVIMGVYNGIASGLIDGAISSILNQSYTDFEFIICDDGSTDNTYEKLIEISKLDKRIILIKNEVNQGLAATLNRCILSSKGEYIARQDADDLSEIKRLEMQIAFLEENQKYDFVGSSIKYFDTSGIWGEYTLPERPEKKEFLFRVPFMHATLMIRRKALKAVSGYRVAKETRRCEDYDLFMRMYAIGQRGYNIQEALYSCCEDVAAHQRRKFIYRVDEVFVRIKGFKSLGLYPVGILYVLKPILVGLIPARVLSFIKDMIYKRRVN